MCFCSGFLRHAEIYSDVNIINKNSRHQRQRRRASLVGVVASLLVSGRLFLGRLLPSRARLRFVGSTTINFALALANQIMLENCQESARSKMSGIRPVAQMTLDSSSSLTPALSAAPPPPEGRGGHTEFLAMTVCQTQNSRHKISARDRIMIELCGGWCDADR
jgi:hypothetical protein